ncbi:M12 family metallopeptidase [Chryseobacterium herbae]|uniref:M12 family metallopeptidase n=1 Tax=Chryseobacterium herbae TaxID=2976476 RepID=A0ABT2IYS4_9FLAO|nr:M12 family metallopeptidase [Chryseobacterium sp. pc1-10]MCT2563985.1 M12 family metallopeptidase [Chryseobacterium sp. pc1-10]
MIKQLKKLAAISSIIFLLGACQDESMQLYSPSQEENVKASALNLRKGVLDCSGQEELFTSQKNSTIIPWGGGLIPYRFPSDYTTSERTMIRTAMEDWENKTGAVVFINVDDPKSSILPKIGYSEAIYQDMLSYSGLIMKRVDKGCSVTDQGIPITNNSGTTTMRLSPTCDLISIKHELGHVLGLIHEHQRSIRNNFIRFPKSTYDDIRVHFPNNIPQLINALSVEVPSYEDPFPFDFTSIMMYGSYPRNNIELKDRLEQESKPLYMSKSNCSLIQRPQGISEKDIKLIRKLYPRKLSIYNMTNTTMPITVSFGVNMYAEEQYNIFPGTSLELIYDVETGFWYYGSIGSSSRAVLALDLDGTHLVSQNNIVTFPESIGAPAIIKYRAGVGNNHTLVTNIKTASKMTVQTRRVNDFQPVSNHFKVETSVTGNSIRMAILPKNR